MYQIIFYCAVVAALAFMIMTLIGIQERLDDLNTIARCLSLMVPADAKGEDIAPKKKLKKDKEKEDKE